MCASRRTEVVDGDARAWCENAGLRQLPATESLRYGTYGQLHKMWLLVREQRSATVGSWGPEYLAHRGAKCGGRVSGVDPEQG